jgi:hypothetical protein
VQFQIFNDDWHYNAVFYTVIPGVKLKIPRRNLPPVSSGPKSEEAACSHEKLVYSHKTWRKNPKDHNLKTEKLSNLAHQIAVNHFTD